MRQSDEQPNASTEQSFTLRDPAEWLQYRYSTVRYTRERVTPVTSSVVVILVIRPSVAYVLFMLARLVTIYFDLK